jgi:membrane protein YqaA with SNARE-associated domain
MRLAILLSSLIKLGEPFRLAALLASPTHQGALLHFLFAYGIVGILLVSIVDSSFVPLPIPGITDIMIVLFAAQHSNLFLLVAASTVGSALGGYFSYKAGHAGGAKFLESHVPERIYKRVNGWMEHHAILAVAVPAILPPPTPLAPFVLAAGASNMSQRKFLSAFTISRLLRHSIAAWLGIRFGKQVLGIWAHFSDKWATTIMVALWVFILIGCGFAFWKLYTTSRSLKSGEGSKEGQAPAPAATRAPAA